jgi:hypothetical protein
MRGLKQFVAIAYVIRFSFDADFAPHVANILCGVGGRLFGRYGLV